ncbi:unnamed protein product [Rodentolepis nana]|uniref:Ribosome biogenesis regulatory protein n=1 Tax=Rodentolepis nana TaxID=102285 RepID=A0A0R3TX93_RODNA|nr:unnamed protein product [Rodentolepis nana]
MELENRPLVADIDLGNLLYEDKGAIDPNDVNKGYIKKLSLNCVHHFLKEFWRLPTETFDEIQVACLPDPKFRLPREKPPPKKREMSRWERFSQMKGIRKQKKSRKVWDDVTQSWKPRWGKDRIDSVKDKWVLEVPDNADPYEDQFEKLNNARKEKRAKNEFNRLKNISRTIKKGQAPPIGVLTDADPSKKAFNRALEITKHSDASMGRFSEVVNEQKVAKKTEKTNGRPKLSGKKSKKSDRVKKSKKGGPSRHANGGKGRGKTSKRK